MKFIWQNIIVNNLLNWFIAPVAYLFRNKAKKGSFLWGFLSRGNGWGDVDWRPKLKNKHIRAILWMYRNPRQNWYWKDYVEGKESDFSGSGKVKSGNDILSWRTMRCLETGNWHGKLLDFNSPLWGKQNITFKRTDINGNIQNCYRKSSCIPHRFLFWIIVVKTRSGHEHGLLQYNYTLPVYSYKKNKQGWQQWKKMNWKEIVI